MENARTGKGFTLFILNEDMNDIIKIIKSEDSGVLIDGVAKTVKHEKKSTATIRQISSFFVSTLSHFYSATSNFFNSKRYMWKRN